MALLNENRNRVPLVVFEAVTGDFDSIRGQMRMITTDGDIKLKVCTTSDTSGDFASGTTVLGGDISYVAVTAGIAGNNITVTHVDPTAISQSLVVSVSGSDITVNLASDGANATTSISTAGEIAAAVNANTPAKALVVATAIGNLTITVDAEALSLSGALANGRKAALNAPGGTVDGDVDYLSVVNAISGLPGPTVEHVDGGASTPIVITVTGNDFQRNVVVTCDIAAATATEIAAAVNANTAAKALVVATAGGDGTGVNAVLAETVLVKAVSNSVWMNVGALT